LPFHRFSHNRLGRSRSLSTRRFVREGGQTSFQFLPNVGQVGVLRTIVTSEIKTELCVRPTIEDRPLSQSFYWRIVGQASDGIEAVQKAETLQPDLVLLDIGLPQLNSIEAARQIRKLASESKSKIIFLSQESSADAVQAALDELLAAVDAVMLGKKYVSDEANYNSAVL
jgi:CheY-like chemotaxis protein